MRNRILFHSLKDPQPVNCEFELKLIASIPVSSYNP